MQRAKAREPEVLQGEEVSGDKPKDEELGSGTDWLAMHVVGIGRVVFETDDAMALAALLSKHHRLKALV